MPGMLYYPFAVAPSPVISQAVLYWDDLSTVVAPGWQGRMSPAMRELLDNGLYRPIAPYDPDEPVPLAEIDVELDFALAQIPLDDLIPPRVAPHDHARTLFTEKLYPSVVEKLLSGGFAYRHPDSPNRLVASPALLHLVVSIVAHQIATDHNARFGGQGPRGLHPYTDSLSAHRVGIDPIPGQDSVAAWKIDIGALLPVPQGEISVRDLIAFREKYAAERVELMFAVQALLHSLRDLHPEDAARRASHDIEKALQDLQKAAQARRLALVTKSVAVTVATGSLALVAGMPDTALPATMMTVLSGLAVNIATSQSRGNSGSGDPTVYRYLERVKESN